MAAVAARGRAPARLELAGAGSGVARRGGAGLGRGGEGRKTWEASKQKKAAARAASNGARRAQQAPKMQRRAGKAEAARRAGVAAARDVQQQQQPPPQQPPRARQRKANGSAPGASPQQKRGLSGRTAPLMQHPLLRLGGGVLSPSKKKSPVRKRTRQARSSADGDSAPSSKAQRRL